MKSESGQATVEYVVVGLVLISMIVALAAVWQVVSDGTFANLVEAHASHALKEVGGLVDAVLF